MFKLKDIIYGMILSIVIMLFALLGYFLTPSNTLYVNLVYFISMFLVSWGAFYLFLDLTNTSNNEKKRNND